MPILAPFPDPDDAPKRTRFRLRAAGAAVVTMAALAAGLTLTRVADPPGRSAGPVEVIGRITPFDANQLDAAVLGPLLREHGPAKAPRAVVVHFRDPACACSSGADRRFLGLIQRQFGRNVLFAFSDPPGTPHEPERGLDRVSQLPPDIAARLWRSLPAAPAIAVFDATGRPLYLGAYGEGPGCSAERGGRVEAALADIDAGRPVVTAPVSGDGACFCPAIRHALAAPRNLAALP